MQRKLLRLGGRLISNVDGKKRVKMKFCMGKGLFFQN